jgi:hypothetical protein
LSECASGMRGIYRVSGVALTGPPGSKRHDPSPECCRRRRLAFRHCDGRRADGLREAEPHRDRAWGAFGQRPLPLRPADSVVRRSAVADGPPALAVGHPPVRGVLPAGVQREVRPVVTGLPLCAPFGHGLTATWSRLRGRCPAALRLRSDLTSPGYVRPAGVPLAGVAGSFWGDVEAAGVRATRTPHTVTATAH